MAHPASHPTRLYLDIHCWQNLGSFCPCRAVNIPTYCTFILKYPGRACLVVLLCSQSLTSYCGASVSNMSDFMWDGGQRGSGTVCLLLITSHHCSVSICHHPLRHAAPLTRHVTSSLIKLDVSSLTWNLAACRVVTLWFLIHVWPNFPLTLPFSGTWKVTCNM